MLLSRLALNLIIHQSSNIILQTCPQLIDSSLISSLLNVSLQVVVDLQDLLIGICEIVFASHGVSHGD